jgi:hypothetical protein
MSGLGTVVAFAVVFAFLSFVGWAFLTLGRAAYLHLIRGKPYQGRGASSGIDSDSAGSV